MRRDERKREKRMNAACLSAQRAKRSDEEQLAKLDAGNWVAKKERAKLNQRIAEKKEQEKLEAQKKEKGRVSGRKRSQKIGGEGNED